MAILIGIVFVLCLLPWAFDWVEPKKKEPVKSPSYVPTRLPPAPAPAKVTNINVNETEEQIRQRKHDTEWSIMFKPWRHASPTKRRAILKQWKKWLRANGYEIQGDKR